GFDGLYRWDAAAARNRIEALTRQGALKQWGNVFAAEQALYDPKGARKLLDTVPNPEPSTSRALVAYLIEALAVTGPPDPNVRADAPFALAMRHAGRLTFMGVNRTAEARTVGFESAGGRTVARMQIPAHGSIDQGGSP